MKLAIYGSGGIGHEVYELAKAIEATQHRWDEIFFIDDNIFSSESYEALEIKKFDQLIDSKSDFEIVVAVGEPSIRQLLYNKISQNNFKCATLIHPSSFVSEFAKIGEGVVICYGSFVSHHVSLDNNVYIQPNVVVGHDSIILAHSVISPGVSIGGAVSIGYSSFIGLNASIREATFIGSNCIVGMGCCLNVNVDDSTIITGNPARVIGINRLNRVFMGVKSAVK